MKEADQALALWLALGEAHAAIAARAAAHAATHGLSLGEISVLTVLARDGPLLLGELQRHVLVSSGGTTFLVDRLTAKGLVRRRVCADDRRATYAALTPKGERRAALVLTEHSAIIREAVAGLSGKRQRAATALLRALAEAANSPPVVDKTRRSRSG